MSGFSKRPDPAIAGMGPAKAAPRLFSGVRSAIAGLDGKQRINWSGKFLGMQEEKKYFLGLDKEA
jgi:hypothetical protein